MKYNIIYADPPWKFKTYSRKGMGRSADNHYDTMTKKDIQNLDVQGLADKNCILFLWVTCPFLDDGMELIKKWGFKYKTMGFNWIKLNKNERINRRKNLLTSLKSNEFNIAPLSQKPEILLQSLTDQVYTGTGYWTRANSELCLLATKGRISRVSKSVHQVKISPVGLHSVKPHDIRDRIVQLVGDLPRVELFARNTTPGWDVWGNKVPNTVELTSRPDK